MRGISEEYGTEELEFKRSLYMSERTDVKGGVERPPE